MSDLAEPTWVRFSDGTMLPWAEWTENTGAASWSVWDNPKFGRVVEERIARIGLRLYEEDA